MSYDNIPAVIQEIRLEIYEATRRFDSQFILISRGGEEHYRRHFSTIKELFGNLNGLIVNCPWYKHVSTDIASLRAQRFQSTTATGKTGIEGMEIRMRGAKTAFSNFESDVKTLIANIETLHSMNDVTKSNSSPELKPNKVFIGHGRSHVWHQLKTFLSEHCTIEAIEFESACVEGDYINQRIESMLTQSACAFIVMTGEDNVLDFAQARPNVIHEAGLFQGRIGFDKTIILREEGCQLFSNLSGLIYAEFAKGNIDLAKIKIITKLQKFGIYKN